jgi:hypothetical protein
MAKPVDKAKDVTASKPKCFVIMPIAAPDGYDKDHFTKVYEDIFTPACESAGYKAIRADEVLQTNLIHLDILQKLIDCPMAICDLSSRNPNVLFELGLRQAFDKPIVLVQETGTPKIFDIAPLRYTEYRKELCYREVLEDQRKIAQALEATQQTTAKGEGVNSIVRILSLARPATLKEVSDGDSSGLLQLIRAEMSEMRSDFRQTMFTLEKNSRPLGSRQPSSDSPLDLARRLVRRAEMMVGAGFPDETVANAIERAQISLANHLDENSPSSVRDEALCLFMQCQEMAGRLSDGGESS